MLLKHQVALCQSNLIDNLQTTQHPENLVHLLPTEVNSTITVSSSIAESLKTSLFAILLISIQFNNLVPRVLSLVSKEEELVNLSCLCNFQHFAITNKGNKYRQSKTSKLLGGENETMSKCR